MPRPTRMSRKTITVVAVVFVAVLLVGAALLTRGGDGISPLDRLSASIKGTQPVAGGPGVETSGSVIGTSTVVGKDRTKQSVAPSRTAEVGVPAVVGANLTTVTTPPPKTLAMVTREAATAGSEYDVVVRVYGWGPTSETIVSAVVLVTESTPVRDVAKPFTLKGRNVLVKLDPKAAAALTRGGSYRGVITLKASGETLIPWFGDVSPAS